MRKDLSALALTVLALAGCTAAQEDADRVASTVAVEHHSVGGTSTSIDEVRDALEQDGMRNEIRTNLDVLLSKSEAYSTPFELERDLFVCEELHPVPDDHEVDHPESEPLATCVRQTFEAYQVGQS